MKVYHRQRLPLINTTLKNSKLELTKSERKKISGIKKPYFNRKGASALAKSFFQYFKNS